MIADAAAEQHGIARTRPIRRDLDAGRNHAHPGRCDEHAVALAPLHHLGIAGDDGHAGRFGGGRHRLHDRSKVGQRKALFEDHPTRQIEGPGAGHGDVVDRAVHGEGTDVAAGKEQRRNDKTVGRHHHPASLHLEAGLVVALGEPGIIEVRLEQFLDQLRHRPAARAVAKFDAPSP